MAFTSKLQTLYFAVNLLGILHLLFFSPSVGTTSSAFTTDLIHRDSPLSPFYNPSSTHSNRLHDAFHRSLKRANHFKSVSTCKIDAPITPGGGEYLMKMSLGTPPVEMVGIVDTGSDLTWTQCKPCIECYKQIPPLFDSSHSSSYKSITCQTDSCNALVNSFCSNSTCAYSYSYADGSFTGGVLATETITLGSDKSVSVPHFAFGCSKNNTGIFDEAGSGIIGLNRGNLSLISQLRGFIDKKFSYCIAPTFADLTPGKITFGSDSIASSNGGAAVTTPIVIKGGDNFYWLTLEALSVGNHTIPYNNSEVDTNPAGNIIIDSGTTVTFLPYKVYQDLEAAVNKVIGGEKINDPLDLFSLCYKDDGYNIQLPNITAHFKGGDVTLQPINTFQKVAYNVICLAMVPSDFAIYGNLAQTNFIVGFNLEASTLSIQPAPCAQL